MRRLIYLFVIALLLTSPRLADARPLPTDLVEVRQAVIDSLVAEADSAWAQAADLDWLVDEQRKQANVAEIFHAVETDTLRGLYVYWKGRAVENEQKELPVIFRSLTSRPAIFVYGFVLGSLVTVKLADAFR